MTSDIETEIKLGLPNEAAWRWVRDRISPVHVVHQTNHYFDRPGRPLARARIGVRLRETTSGIRLTVKGEAEGAEDAVITRRIELERAVPPSVLTEALTDGLWLREDILTWRSASEGADPVQARFLDRLDAAIADGPLRSIGAFRNVRAIGSLRLSDEAGALDIEVELDRTRFPGDRTDFELEIERSSEPAGHLERTRLAVERWLDEEGGIRPFARESKLARFDAILEAGESPSR